MRSDRGDIHIGPEKLPNFRHMLMSEFCTLSWLWTRAAVASKPHTNKLHVHRAAVASRDAHAARSGSELTAFIPHSVAGADIPFCKRASVMATYVFDGKVSKPRQFQTAFTVLPVISATAELPPKASITSEVVFSCSAIPLE